MWDKLQNWLIKKFLVGFLLEWVDKLLKKLPEDERKTVSGFAIAILGVLLKELPASDVYLQPLLDMLHQLPHDALVTTGVLYSIVGMFHKGVKWLKAKLSKDETPEAIVTDLPKE